MCHLFQSVWIERATSESNVTRVFPTNASIKSRHDRDCAAMLWFSKFVFLNFFQNKQIRRLPPCRSISQWLVNQCSAVLITRNTQISSVTNQMIRDTLPPGNLKRIMQSNALLRRELRFPERIEIKSESVCIRTWKSFSQTIPARAECHYQSQVGGSSRKWRNHRSRSVGI